MGNCGCGDIAGYAETDQSLDTSIQDGAAIFAADFPFKIGSVVGGVRIAVLAAAFNEDVSLDKLVTSQDIVSRLSSTHLKRVLSRETLITVGARERLHGQMNSLVAFQIVIAIEALWALVALEWSIGSRGGHAMRRRVGPV